jgi:hypothetical protein
MVYGRKTYKNRTNLNEFFNSPPQGDSPGDLSLVAAMRQLENLILSKYGKTCNLLSGSDRQKCLTIFENARMPGSVGWRLRTEFYDVWALIT